MPLLQCEPTDHFLTVSSHLANLRLKPVLQLLVQLQSVHYLEPIRGGLVQLTVTGW